MHLAHHPDHGVLIEHAAGKLAPGQALVVSTHLRACSACRAEVGFAEAVGGALFSGLPPAELAPDALAHALARIERPSNARRPAAPVAPTDWIRVPFDVAQAARRRRWAAPGVWVAPVGAGPGNLRTYLLRVGAGMSVPRHTHRGAEMTCVLKGAFVDGEATYGPGDFAFGDPALEHQPRITADGECVCLVAAQGALIPRDWVGRLFQPFVRI